MSSFIVCKKMLRTHTPKFFFYSDLLISHLRRQKLHMFAQENPARSHVIIVKVLLEASLSYFLCRKILVRCPKREKL